MAVTLRSGKELDEPKKDEKTKKKVEHKNLENEEKIEAETKKGGVEVNNKGGKKKSNQSISGRITFPDNPPLYTPPLPFPHKFRKTRMDEQFSKFMNMLKKLEINILFVDALAQIPNYVKFMKGIMSNKKKLEAYGIVTLSETAMQSSNRNS